MTNLNYTFKSYTPAVQLFLELPSPSSEASFPLKFPLSLSAALEQSTPCVLSLLGIDLHLIKGLVVAQ